MNICYAYKCTVLCLQMYSLPPYSLEDDLFRTELKDRRGADGIKDSELISEPYRSRSFLKDCLTCNTLNVS